MEKIGKIHSFYNFFKIRENQTEEMLFFWRFNSEPSWRKKETEKFD